MEHRQPAPSSIIVYGIHRHDVTMSLLKRLDFIFFDAGGGHRSAANALKQIMLRQGPPRDIRMVNLQELLDSLDLFRRITGLRLQDLYNLMLKKGWTLGSAHLIEAMHGIIRLYHPAQVRLLEKFWAESRPDLVVSLVPNFNRALGESLRRALPGTPLVTILTDLADYPPHFWIERQEQYVICGSEKAVQQARQQCYPERRIFRTSGMILNPRFYEPVSIDRRVERQRLGLDPDLPTALVLFGGEGSAVMREIAQRLDASGLKLQLILICGKNQKLAERLKALQHRIPMYVEGFTKDVPFYMRLSDIFIGKPGPGSISEALAMKLPVIVERNAFTLPQERYNAEWISECGAGLVLRNFRRIDSAVAEMLEPVNYQRFRDAAAVQNNRALFEIPEILEAIFRLSAASS